MAARIVRARPGRALLLAATFALSLLLAWTGSSLPHTFGAAPPIWLSNAVLLAILLRSPRVLWLPLAGLGTVGMAIAGLLAGNPPALAAALALCNGLEVLLAALALQRVIGTGDIARPANVARFILTITVAAILGGALSALVVGLPFDRATFAELLIWVTADLTGLAVVTPSLYLLHLFWPSVRKLAGWQVWPLALHVAVTILVFALSQQPLTYLVAVSLIFTTYRLRMVGASLGVLATMTIALAATLMGRGADPGQARPAAPDWPARRLPAT